MTQLTDSPVAIVTGGGAGIGAAIGAKLQTLGYDVALADLSFAEAPEVETESEASGGRRLTMHCDVTDENSVNKFVAQVKASFGPASVLVNNAGIYPFQAFETISLQDWRRVMAVNLDGGFNFTQAVIADMKQANWGRIIFIGSNTFQMGMPGMAHYVSSKGAITGLTRSLAKEFGEYGITVNCVVPTLTQTEGTTDQFEQSELVAGVVNLQSIKRAGNPDDISGVVGMLLGDAAAFITGQSIVADGGLVHV